VEHLILEVSRNAQCILSTSAVLRHKLPPLKEIAISEKITATTGTIRITENSKDTS
jgi:hypothetical protein